jgi:hypothetical protein
MSYPKLFYEKSHPTMEDFGKGIDTTNPVSAMDGKILCSESGLSDTDRKFQVNMEK